jgi:siroheme synthase
VTIVSNATLPSQQVCESSLGSVRAYLDAHVPPTPAIVIVGKVGKWRTLLHWYKDALVENKVG